MKTFHKQIVIAILCIISIFFTLIAPFIFCLDSVKEISEATLSYFKATWRYTMIGILFYSFVIIMARSIKNK